MALPDLASTTDLSARGVTPTSVHTVMLAVASSVVRAAAGSPILATTSTVTLWGLDPSHWLDLPGKPVTSVASVVHDGATLTADDDYKLVDGRLWNASSWGNGGEPLKVTVTLTHGFAVVPAHIVQLVCDLAILGAATAADGAHDPSVLVESIDDYSVTFSAAAGGLASAMELPAATRRALRKQFGGGAAMVSSR